MNGEGNNGSVSSAAIPRFEKLLLPLTLLFRLNLELLSRAHSFGLVSQVVGELLDVQVYNQSPENNCTTVSLPDLNKVLARAGTKTF